MIKKLFSSIYLFSSRQNPNPLEIIKQNKTGNFVNWLCLGMFFVVSFVNAATYYSRATGNFATLGSWSTSPTGTPTNVTALNPADNFIIQNGHTITVANAITINNLTIDAGGTLAVGGVNFTVSGTTSISGTLTHSSTNNTKTFVGLVAVNTGGTWTNIINEAISFRGGVSNNGTFTSGTGTQTFDTNAQGISGNVIMSNVTVTGIVLTNNGVFTVSASLRGNGSLTNASNQTFTISGGGTKDISTLSNAGTMNVEATAAITTALANFTNTGTLNLNGSGAIAGITNNAGGTVNLSNSGTINSFNNASASSVLQITAASPAITTLTATATGNTVNYNGAAQTVKATTYSNLTLSGSGTKTFGATTTINNNLSIASGVIANLGTGLTHTANTLTLAGLISSSGSWGSSTSAATNKNDTYFSAATGIVTITTSSCTAPTLYAITGTSGGVCSSATGIAIGLSNSEINVNYQLLRGAILVGSPVAGTGSAISFGNLNTTGNYTVLATRTSTFCVLTMTGSVNVYSYSSPPLPTATKTDVTCSNDSTGTITITNAVAPSSVSFTNTNTGQNDSTPMPYIDLGQKLLSNLANFSVEGWIKFDPGNYINRMSLFGQNDAIEIGFEGSNLRCWTPGAGQVDISLSPAFLAGSTWHHIAVTGDGTAGGLRIYIDGLLKVSGGTATSNYSNNTGYNTKIGWGVMDVNGVGFTGEVFKVGLWNRALTAAEITSLSSGFVTYDVSLTGLIAGYSFTEPTTNTTTLSGVGSNAPTGSLLNGAVRKDPYTYSWTSIPAGFTSSSINLTGLAPRTYNLITSLKGCTNTGTWTVNAINTSPTAPIIGTVIQPCTSSTASVALSGLPSSGSWTITATPATAGLTGLTGTNTATTTVGGLTANTSYTFTVNNGTCPSTASTAAVTNTVPATATWNGSIWSNTASTTTPPVITQPIIFTGNYTSSGNINGCSCTVSSGNVVISSGNTMTITNAVTVNTGSSLTFEDSASLVQITDVTSNANSGNITYKRVSQPMRNFDYTYWSSPVAGQTLYNLSPNTLWDKYYSFSGTDWSFESSSNVMKKGIGYIIRTPKPNFWPDPMDPTYAQPVEFIGIPNNGNITSTQSMVSGNFYLIGNPYPSALDADDFLFTNTNNHTVLNGTIYFWTHNTQIQQNGSFYQYTSNDYASYNFTGGTGTGSSSGNSGVNNSVPDGYIAAGQSFFASAKANGTVEFNNTMRQAGNNTQFFKPGKSSKSSGLEKNRLWLNMTNTAGAFKQTLIGYIGGATNAYDSDFDGITFDGNTYIDFYSVNATDNLVIQGRALPFNDADTVPLGYRSTIAGNFTIAIDKADGVLATQKIYLEDKVTNTISELTAKNYTFTTKIGTFDNRFVLRYTNNTLGTGDFETKEEAVTVAVLDKIITINSTKENINKVFIYDISGKLLHKKQAVGNSQLVLQNLPFAQQVLLVKVVLENGSDTTKNVIFK